MVDRCDTAPCGLVEFNDDGTIVYANAVLAKWLGETSEPLAGRKIESILTVAHRIFFQTHFFPLLSLHGHAEEIFLALRARDGTPVPVLASARRRTGPEGARSQCVFLTVHQRRKYEDEILRAQQTAEEALKNNDELRTAKRELEVKTQELELRLRQTQMHNEDLRHATQILSHDLREPVRKIGLFADLIRGHARSEPEAVEALRKIALEGERMENLIHAIREFLQPDVDSPVECVDLKAAVESAAAAVALKIGFTDWLIDCETLPSIDGRKRQLHVLFGHLFENAVKFRERGRRLRIHVRGQVIQENLFAETKDRYHYVDFARIEFQDNGVGFDPKYRDYVFRLLKKVDLESPGLGVGLALCRKIAALHYGTIRVDPKPGVGTTFTLTLPLRHQITTA